MLASLVKGLCSYPHSPGRKPYLSRVKRVTPGISLGGVRREVSDLAASAGEANVRASSRSGAAPNPDRASRISGQAVAATEARKSRRFMEGSPGKGRDLIPRKHPVIRILTCPVEPPLGCTRGRSPPVNREVIESAILSTTL